MRHSPHRLLLALGRVLSRQGCEGVDYVRRLERAVVLHVQREAERRAKFRRWMQTAQPHEIPVALSPNGSPLFARASIVTFYGHPCRQIDDSTWEVMPRPAGVH